MLVEKKFHCEISLHLKGVQKARKMQILLPRQLTLAARQRKKFSLGREQMRTPRAPLGGEREEKSEYEISLQDQQLPNRKANKSLSDSICHQVFATDEAEDSYLVVFVKNTEGAEYLVQGGTAGRNIIHHQDILVPNRGTKFLTSFFTNNVTHLPQHRLGKAVDIAQHILIHLAR